MTKADSWRQLIQGESSDERHEVGKMRGRRMGNEGEYRPMLYEIDRCRRRRMNEKG